MVLSVPSFFSTRHFYGYLGIIVSLFFFGILIGFLYPDDLTFLTSPPLEDFITQSRESAAGKSFLELGIFILIHNIAVSVIAVLFGLFFGIIPLLAALGNGYMFGYLASGYDSFVPIAQTLLFAVPEIFALVFAWALGLQMGMEHLRRKLRENHDFFSWLFLSFAIVGFLCISLASFLFYRGETSFVTNGSLFFAGLALMAPSMKTFFAESAHRRQERRVVLKKTLLLYVKISVPLLIVGALLEVIAIALWG